MLAQGTLQSLLVAHVLSFQQVNIPNIVASAGVRVWLLRANYAALRGKVFPRGLARAGLITGLGFVVLVLVPGFLIYPSWAIWLGRWLLAQPHTAVQLARAGWPGRYRSTVSPPEQREAAPQAT